MGSITSRGKWPPDPPRRSVLRWEQKLVEVNGKIVSKLVQVEDYTIDWGSLKCSGSSREDKPGEEIE